MKGAFVHMVRFCWTCARVFPMLEGMGVLLHMGSEGSGRSAAGRLRAMEAPASDGAGKSSRAPVPPPPSADAVRPMGEHPVSLAPDDSSPASDGADLRVSLGELSGVRDSDLPSDFHARVRRSKPRLRLRAKHALAAMLLLTMVTCASLTLLVRQSLNYAAVSAASAAGCASSGGVSSSGSDVASEGDEDTSSDDGSADAASPSDDAVAAPEDTRLDLNTATKEQLDTLPGVGPVTAERIIEHRNRIGRFTSVDQLLDVTGIGSKTLEKIRPGARV